MASFLSGNGVIKQSLKFDQIRLQAEKERGFEESCQPLSLLANHDEHDLINLSSFRLHDDNATGPENASSGSSAGSGGDDSCTTQTTNPSSDYQRTVIKIGDESSPPNPSSSSATFQRRRLPEKPSMTGKGTSI